MSSRFEIDFISYGLDTTGPTKAHPKENTMIASPLKRNSETALMETIHKFSDAGGSVIQVKTREPLRAATTIRKHLISSNMPYREWDIVNGVRVGWTGENYMDHLQKGNGEDFLTALMLPLNDLRTPTSQVIADSERTHYILYLNPHPFFVDNPMTQELLQQYAAIFPATNICIILVTPEVEIPGIPVGTILIADLVTPAFEELQGVLARTLEGAQGLKEFPEGIELDEEDIERVCNMGLGLSLYEFETYAALSIIDAGLAGEKSITAERMLSGLAEGKTAVVKQSEILELSQPEDIDSVGGMGRLKDWLKLRAGCYSAKAKEFGIESPKGMVLVGVPGSGKSLVAKVTASVLGVPLVRIDFGRVFSKYIGDSEQRIRSALKMVEAMAPCVLFADEIDKGLGGAGGGSDSGTSSRVLGSYLTWLQECKAPVFSVVTANRVEGLPPELLRRGRFDQIFSVGMPSGGERLEVLEIHLEKRGRKIDGYTSEDNAAFIKASQGYVPAEIESAVKDAIIAAYNTKSRTKPVTMDLIVSALKGIVPMSQSHKDAMDRMTAWAASNAISVSYPSAAESAPGALVGGGRVIRAGRGAS